MNTGAIEIILIIAGVIAVVLLIIFFYYKISHAIGGKDKECQNKYGSTAWWGPSLKQCYKCPEGTAPTVGALATAADKCQGPCTGGSKPEPNGHCYGCKPGYSNKGHPKVCTAPNCQSLNKTWWETGITGKCYECPPGTRGSGSYNSPDFCFKGCIAMYGKGSNETLDGKCVLCKDGLNLAPPYTSKSKCITNKTCKQLFDSSYPGKIVFSNPSGQDCYVCKSGFAPKAHLKWDRACGDGHGNRVAPTWIGARVEPSIYQGLPGVKNLGWRADLSMGSSDTGRVWKAPAIPQGGL